MLLDEYEIMRQILKQREEARRRGKRAEGRRANKEKTLQRKKRLNSKKLEKQFPKLQMILKIQKKILFI